MMRLGVNIEDVKPEGRTWPFADLFRQRSAWVRPSDDQPCKLDSNGDPTEDCKCYLVQGSDSNPVPVPVGKYTLTFSGAAVISSSPGIFDVFGQAFDLVSGRTTAILDVKPNSLNLGIKFVGTNKGIRNAKLLIPGHSDADTYNKALIDLLSKFAVIRPMDFMHTNDNPISRWSERTPADGVQTGPAGAAWEHAIGLANAANTDLWVNVPHKADDDYVRSLAALVASTLSKNLRVYVSYSNEVWNPQFGQYHWNHAQASVEKSQNYPYAYSGDQNPNNDVYWGYRRMARRTAEIGATFRRAFGEAGAPFNRVRPIFEHQLYGPGILPDVLAWMEARIGTPNAFLWGAAVAPYLPTSPADRSNPSLSAAGIVTSMRGMILSLVPELQRTRKVCDAAGIHSTAYEIGTDTNTVEHKIPAAAMVGAQALPAMGSLVFDFVNAISPYLDLGCYYMLAGGYGGEMNWALTDQFLAMTPRLAAALSFAKINNAADPVAAPLVTPSRKLTATINVYSDGSTETITK